MPPLAPFTRSVQFSRHLGTTRRIIGTVAGAAVGIALTHVLTPALLGIFGFSIVGPVVGKLSPFLSQK